MGSNLALDIVEKNLEKIEEESKLVSISWHSFNELLKVLTFI